MLSTPPKITSLLLLALMCGLPACDSSEGDGADSAGKDSDADDGDDDSTTPDDMNTGDMTSGPSDSEGSDNESDSGDPTSTGDEQTGDSTDEQSGDDSEKNCDGLVSDGVEVGNLPPDFTTMDQFGNEHSLHEHCGDYIYLVNGAMWCTGCKMTASTLPALAEKYADRGFTILNMHSADPDNKTVEVSDLDAWAKTLKFIDGMYVLADNEAAIFSQLYPEIENYMGEMFIGPDMRIICKGAEGACAEEVKATLDSAR